MKNDSVITKKDDTLQIKIEPSLKEAFVKRSEAEGMSASARVRMLIREFLDRRRK